MIFNGHTPNTIDDLDEETFADICVMYGDGVLGGRNVYDALTPITTAIFNYLRDPKTPQFKPDRLFPWIGEYEISPDTAPDAKEAVSNSLLLLMTQAPGFDIARFNNEHR